MKILVLGANGGVGSRLVVEARRRGHEVTAGTREFVDATDPGSVARAAAGHDVVLSAVISRAAPELLPMVARALLTGLEQAGSPRLIAVGGAGTLEVEPGRYVMDLEDFNPDYKAEALAHLEVLRTLQQARTPVTWTVITPPRQFDDRGRTGSYRVGGDKILYNGEGRSRISLEDFAVAVLDEAEHPQHARRRFTVSY